MIEEGVCSTRWERKSLVGRKQGGFISTSNMQRSFHQVKHLLSCSSPENDGRVVHGDRMHRSKNALPPYHPCALPEQVWP